MLVAQSFSSTFTTRTSTPSGSNEKEPDQSKPSQSRDGVRRFGWRPAIHQRFESPQSKPAKSSVVATTSDRSSSPPAAVDSACSDEQRSSRPTPSRPVTVPNQRGKNVKEASSAPQTSRAASVSQQRLDHSDVSPSVAALLASTAIPPRKTFTRQRPLRSATKRMSGEDLVAEWKRSEVGSPSSLGTSPGINMLLGEEDDEEESTTLSEDEEQSLGPTNSNSSVSMPSMDDDSQSGVSFSFASTPGGSMPGEHRRTRKVSTPRSVDCGLDHPLLHDEFAFRTRDMPPSHVPNPFLAPRSETAPRSFPKDSTKSVSGNSPRRPSSFKSNLTASLTNFRSNISRTFANFAAPSLTLPDDHLLRGFLGQPYHPEMRPRHMTGVPDPRLRRYLNPHAFQPYDFHLHNSHVDDADHEFIAAASAAAVGAGAGDLLSSSPDAFDAIPMRSFERRNPRTDVKQNSARTEAGRARSVSDQQQRREPRENPEFLRIAVLELQMRRAGKTQGRPVGSSAGMGRRGWWLPPRAANSDEDSPASMADGLVPRRWQGVSVA